MVPKVVGSIPITRPKNYTQRTSIRGGLCYYLRVEDCNYLLAVGVFVAYVLVDGLYAYYTLAVVRRDAMASATTGAAMHFLLALGVISYVKNYLYIIPLAMGSWLGTYIVVRYIKK